MVSCIISKQVNINIHIPKCHFACYFAKKTSNVAFETNFGDKEFLFIEFFYIILGADSISCVRLFFKFHKLFMKN